MNLDDMLKELRNDIKEIKQHQLDLVKQGVLHNHLLKEHERRSVALEEGVKLYRTETESRMRPIEEDLKFRSKLRTLFLGSSGFIALIAVLATIWKNLK